MKRHTKIVATLGPSSDDESEIEKVVSAGMDIARLNFSHGSYKEFERIVTNIRKIEKESGKRIGILQDLQGPKIRLGTLPAKGIRVNRGDVITFSVKNGDKNTIFVPFPPLPKVVKPGQRLLIEDGLIRTKILSIKSVHVKVLVKNGGILKSHKGINIPDSHLPPASSLTEKDRKDLKFGIKKLKVDAVAISFVETEDDVKRVKKTIGAHTSRQVMVISKIERSKALKNIEAIVRASDGIMVARGDLGIETPLERVPIEQKRLIKLCREMGKPVIVATQILQSMVDSPLPTRAEISDAATAVFEQTDAYMLSNETAVGKYAAKAVRTLAEVAETVEKNMNDSEDNSENCENTICNLKNGSEGKPEDYSIASGAVLLAKQIHADNIVVVSRHGFTARTILRLRPKTPVIVVTNSEETAKLLNFYWGIEHILVTKRKLRSEEVKELLKEKGFLKRGQKIVFTSLKKEKRSLVTMSI
ncbi:MAG: pyruvate kinase [Candidatus Gracilibacteria bacterium]|jgi:pyruvate kinase